MTNHMVIDWNVWDKGYDAYWDNKPATDNPYDPRTSDYIDWADGFRFAGEYNKGPEEGKF